MKNTKTSRVFLALLKDGSEKDHSVEEARNELQRKGLNEDSMTQEELDDFMFVTFE